MKKYLPRLVSLVIIISVILSFNFALGKYRASKSGADVQGSNASTYNQTTPPQHPKPGSQIDGGLNSSGASTNTKGVAIPILMYHEICAGPNSLYVPVDKFRAQMNYLLNSGYHTVTMAQAQEMLVNGQIPAKTIVLTFDDGYTSFYTQAWPIMQECGFTGTVYVCSSFSGRDNYLTWEEIQTLQAGGIEIGSHTQNHIDLKTANSTKQIEEIQGSKRVLEEQIGVPIKSFCYPTGTYSETTPTIVKEAGYTSAVTVTYGHATSQNNLYLIPRMRVPGWITLDNFAKSIP